MHRTAKLLKRIHVLLIIPILISLSACTTATAPDLVDIPSDYIALPPDREAESRVIAHIEFTPPSFEAPDVTSFEIFFENVHRCHGRDFITIRVENTGDFDFIWATEWLIFDWTGDDELDAMSQYNVAKPFMPDARSCPTPEGHSDLLEPGDTAYIGVYVGFDFDDHEYESFGDRGWEDINWLTFYVELSTNDYPYTASIRPRTLDITFVIEDMPDRDRRAPTTAPESPPTSAPAPTATKMPTIGGD
jgi:hypothetical protein